MDIALFPSLQSYFNERLADADGDERAQMENFLLDERPSAEGQNVYRTHLSGKAIQDIGDWQNQHANYLKEELQIDPAESKRPWTFRAENDFNRLCLVKPEFWLVRVEDAHFACEGSGIDPERLKLEIEKFSLGDAAAGNLLAKFAKIWNERRDQRPQYATTWEEVGDILEDGKPDWAERLRDRLGLGDYDPGESGEPIPVLLMRYPVSDAIAAWEGQGHPAVPTLLDGSLSRFFFPTPFPAPDCHEAVYGHTLNLTPVDGENDYSMGVELLHPRFDYQPEHFHRVGYIKKPVGLSLEKARRFHLPWLRLRYERDDFGAAP